MELDQIQALMDRFENSDVRELKIDDGDFHLYLSKNRQNNNPQATLNPVKAPAATKAVETENAPAPAPKKATGKAIKAPIVGIVYLQAKPGQPAFVKPGDHVKAGDTICIIEAMKMMTEVKSDLTGTVTAVNVENEDLVEVDQPLITVEED
ncbi:MULTISPECIES: acetyl-CoA carboxylase biotin carboxyl carrier protein [Lactobacillus]|uniref:Biotin carboxyl carrier protein of acetyl-CoA carboxylase n=1 Tax=Lactobacillus xujianguonis TaxID=2495899 RepID=A0A437STQ7_9LACO|nr:MULTISPECIES: acetyl-CoA carboxylase biotin carboxyl carrier protein [Lactobacillus]RVU70329.1 acetyl-CoA carboxylase biotin carboxyl carrier protein [Lactobacillus xujianguonis]RVU76872.1 acetyl-CoA carboxylase biotin carboxyl carrier protein [Lactobacillus xujianguonis]